MKKVVVIAVVLIAVAAVALLVLRPGGTSTRTDPPGWLRTLGDLGPRRDVTPAEVAGQPCWAGDTLTVPPGGTCETRLPAEADRIRICLDSGPFLRVDLDGSEYGPQNVDHEQVACPDGKRFTLYDTGTRLVARCAPLGDACVARLR